MFKTDPRCRVFLSTDSGGVGSESAERQRRRQLRPALEPGEARAADRPRVAQAPDAQRHRHQPGVGEHHRAADAGNAGGQAQPGGRRARRGGRRHENPAQAWPPGFHGPAETGDRDADSAAEEGRAGRKPKSSPVDRSAGFASRASELLGPRLVACEERYPEDGAHSVILVVVDREAQDMEGEGSSPFTTELFGKDKIDSALTGSVAGHRPGDLRCPAATLRGGPRPDHDSRHPSSVPGAGAGGRRS